MASFVVDEDLPVSLAEALRLRGHDAIAVAEAGLQGATDRQVLDFAKRRSAILITEDLDFSNILDFPLGSHFGIVVLRMSDDVPYASRLRRVVEVVDEGLADRLSGCLAIVESTRVRVRRL